MLMNGKVQVIWMHDKLFSLLSPTSLYVDGSHRRCTSWKCCIADIYQTCSDMMTDSARTGCTVHNYSTPLLCRRSVRSKLTSSLTTIPSRELGCKSGERDGRWGSSQPSMTFRGGPGSNPTLSYKSFFLKSGTFCTSLQLFHILTSRRWLCKF